MRNLILLMLGDSLIDFGDWSARLSGHRVLSRGVPGERAEELLWRLPQSVPDLAPDAIVLMTGTNNLLSGDQDFPETIERTIQELQRRYPAATCLITSLLPYRIADFSGAVQRTNDRLRLIAEQTDSWYCDIYSPFEKSKDDLFTFDGVHLSEAGYRLWAEKLKKMLTRLENEPV